MLLNCPECSLPVSDKAISCPHCGYPMKPELVAQAIKQKKPPKRRRLPNGFGQISHVKNRNLRKPYRAMITVGKTPDGRPVTKPLMPTAYFATYNEAYQALVNYGQSPYDLDAVITVSQLYEKWIEVYQKTLKADSSLRTVTSVWSYCHAVWNMRVADLRARHIKGCMEDGVSLVRGKERKASAGVKCRIKSLFNLLLDYALEFELVDRNYARTFNVSDEVIKEKEDAKRNHIPFNEKEMETLWANYESVKYADVVLIQCYSGWRPQELGLLRLENINLLEGTMIGGMKTEAGQDRVVPIHPRILPLVETRYKEAQKLNSAYLINCTDGQTHVGSLRFTYDKYQVRFQKIRVALGLNPQHRPHDGRVQFVTMAKRHKVDEYAIKYIVGHSIIDLTEKVYTQRDSAWLRAEIEKIP